MRKLLILTGLATTTMLCFAPAAHAGNSGPKPIEVRVTTADSTILSADLHLPFDTGQARFPVVILMHMRGDDRSVYKNFIPLLLARRWAVLNVDLRGHGKSTVVHGAKRTVDDLQETDYQQMPADLDLLLAAALKRFPRLDTLRIGVVGASIGSSVAVFFGAEHPGTQGIVLLSPGLTYRSLEVRLPLMRYGRRPVLILVGRKDRYAHESSVILESVAQGEKKLVVYDIAEHGTDILPAVKGADSLVVNWLGGRL